MNITNYYARPAAYAKCSMCEKKVMVMTQEMIGGSESSDDLMTQIEDEIADKMQADGWGYENAYCPDCMTTHGAEINAIERADDKDAEGER
jgi:hypothetical protein